MLPLVIQLLSGQGRDWASQIFQARLPSPVCVCPGLSGFGPCNCACECACLEPVTMSCGEKDEGEKYREERRG